MIRMVLAAAPIALAILAFAVLEAVDLSPAGYRVLGVFIRAIGAAGCFIAAAQFDRADYLRRAWTFYGLGFVFLLINAVVFGAASRTGAQEAGTTTALLRGLLVITANTFTVIGTVMVARAWQKAGLSLTVSSAARTGVFIGSLVLGLGVVGSSLLRDLGALFDGRLDAIARVASDLGDIVTLAVLGPILLTALALRGGSLAWPWSLIVLGTLGWLFVDATVMMGGLLNVQRENLRPLEETFRILACTSFLSAGLLQMLAVRSTSATAPAPS